jgi:protein SCO1/2
VNRQFFSGMLTVLVLSLATDVPAQQPGITGDPIVPNPASDPMAKYFDKVGVDPQLDAPLPLDTVFKDEDGRAIKLGSLFPGDRPILLTLNYSSCPLLCQTHLEGLVDALKKIDDLDAGRDFDVVRVSIDPLESPSQAILSKQRFTTLYQRSGTNDGWHFLTGNQASITRLADAVGFRYAYVPETGEYAHTAALILCTPEGRVSRYVDNIAFDPGALRLNLVEAGEGKIGTAMDHLVLYCFAYNPSTGKYTLVAVRLMKLAGGLTVAILLLALGPYWIRSALGRSSHQDVGEGPKSIPASP